MFLQLYKTSQNFSTLLQSFTRLYNTFFYTTPQNSTQLYTTLHDLKHTQHFTILYITSHNLYRPLPNITILYNKQLYKLYNNIQNCSELYKTFSKVNNTLNKLYQNSTILDNTLHNFRQLAQTATKLYKTLDIFNTNFTSLDTT